MRLSLHHLNSNITNIVILVEKNEYERTKLKPYGKDR